MTDKTPSDLAALAEEIAGSGVKVEASARPRPAAKEQDKTTPKPEPRASAPKSPRAGSDVDAALTALDQAYGAVQLGLMMLGAHAAAANLADSLPGLREQNLSFLTQDREMAKRIAGLGKTGGRFGFFAAQAMVFGPVGVLAMAELKAKRAAKVESEGESTAPAMFPGAMFDMPETDK